MGALTIVLVPHAASPKSRRITKAEKTTNKIDKPEKEYIPRFGLLLAAGLLAVEYEILPLERDDIDTGLKKCFNDWLENRGTIGHSIW